VIHSEPRLRVNHRAWDQASPSKIRPPNAFNSSAVVVGGLQLPGASEGEPRKNVPIHVRHHPKSVDRKDLSTLSIDFKDWGGQLVIHIYAVQDRFGGVITPASFHTSPDKAFHQFVRVRR
jgi:hypothetical protein